MIPPPQLVAVNTFQSTSTFTWETKWNHFGLRFQTGMKTSSVHMKFHFGCISKRPNILMDMCRHFISGSVYMTLYLPKWNFISAKMSNMKSKPALTFKRTCALNATSNESALIHFVLGYFSVRLVFYFTNNFFISLIKKFWILWTVNKIKQMFVLKKFFINLFWFCFISKTVSVNNNLASKRFLIKL